jgi:glycosyltransferase involved in cell wall biosynthesis
MKVIFISSMLPSGHYSQYLAGGLNLVPSIELIVYADKKIDNLVICGCGQIKNVWSKTVAYIPQIIREIRKDRPDIVHVQHELNMYGGMTTAALFPVLLLMLRAMRCRVVTTVHAAVYKKQIDPEFMSLFHRDSALFGPVLLKVFFHYVFKAVSICSDRIIVHTNLAKEILVADYGMNAALVDVIPISIPVRAIKNKNKKPYFFYFGYMVRRKGLGFALEGFKRFVEENPDTSYKLVLAGGVIGGQEKAFEEIKTMINLYCLQDKVVIKGFVEEHELNQLYWDAEAVIIPAKVSMGSSGPLFHAVSYGKCTIASKVGHFLEDIEHLKTGVLVDNDKWQEAFQWVVDNPGMVSPIEHAVAQKAARRMPSVIAGMHMAAYTLATES